MVRQTVFIPRRARPAAPPPARATASSMRSARAPANTDPNHDCIDSASDPSGKCGGICNGQWGCQFPPLGMSCGTCKQCDGASKCIIKPDDDDACGVIDCDMLDTSCSDYHDVTR